MTSALTSDPGGHGCARSTIHTTVELLLRVMTRPRHPTTSGRVWQDRRVERHEEGGPDSFRLRHGQWRAIYRIDREAQEMQVQIIDTRGSVYR